MFRFEELEIWKRGVEVLDKILDRVDDYDVMSLVENSVDIVFRESV